MAEHADPVPELEHELVVWQQIGAAPAHLDIGVLEAGNLQAAERHAHHTALGRVDTDVVELGSVCDDRRG